MADIQKTLQSGRVVIFVDNRELRSNVTRHLRSFDTMIREKQLEVGDYICSDRVGVERKRVSDFIQSIVDQRIFRQLESLSNTFCRPVLIIEGNPDLLFLDRNMHSNAIRGALSSIAIDYHIPIIWTGNSRETAAQIFWMANREQVLGKRGVQIRASRKVQSVREQQEYLVAGLPGINSVRSRKLLEHFKSPENVFRASEEELKHIDGFGEKTAKRIKKVLSDVYSAE